jgi:hypothetical protein
VRFCAIGGCHHTGPESPWPTSSSTPRKHAGAKSNAPELVALVRAGAVFHKGKLLERRTHITPTKPQESTETEVA